MKSCHLCTTWMDLEGIMLSEISQTEKDKYYMISLICGILKKKANEKKTETDSQTQKTNLQLPKGKGGEG